VREEPISEEEMIRWLNEKNHELGFEVLLTLLRNTLERIKSSISTGDIYTWKFSYILETAMNHEREKENKVWDPSKLNELEKRVKQLELMMDNVLYLEKNEKGDTQLRGND
jgi:hypothetical protein